MTREEIKNIVRHVFHFYEVNAENCNWTDMNKACGEIFEALEQELIIDKIRAEIEQNAYFIVHGVNNHEKGMTLNGILQIIDKYKAESEEV